MFPAIAAAHPERRDVLRNLQQDHSTIAYLLGALQAAVDRTAPVDELDRHLDGVEAIMESHVRDEERSLGVALALELDTDPGQVLGPL
ncbi:hemerythrin domain-containing protein [Micropruina sp.]|uniref:hemerythrin domain-containing protein n=1 Tax=Micropruina sp. TaxID=2737536 RepID=UPI0039E5131B